MPAIDNAWAVEELNQSLETYKREISKLEAKNEKLENSNKMAAHQRKDIWVTIVGCLTAVIVLCTLIIGLVYGVTGGHQKAMNEYVACAQAAARAPIANKTIEDQCGSRP